MMNIPMPNRVLVVITSPPSLESQIVDWLLATQDGVGFSSVAAHGHSTRHDHLSIAEQVSGRQKRIQFQVQIDGRQLDSLLEELKSEFGGADLHYWVVPVLAGGHVG
jgi:hypothetical protein